MCGSMSCSPQTTANKQLTLAQPLSRSVLYEEKKGPGGETVQIEVEVHVHKDMEPYIHS